MSTFYPPPNWPAPPPGWLPPPGWQPDPSWPPAPLGWKFWVTTTPHARLTAPPRRGRSRLDDVVRSADSRHWTLTLGFAPVLAIVAVLGIEYLMLRGWYPGTVYHLYLHGTAYDLAFGVSLLLHYAVAVAVLVRLGGPLARDLGSWYAAFGWGRLSWSDLGIGAVGALGELLLRIAAAVVLVIAVPALRHGSASNVELSGRPTIQIWMLIIVAVLIAPAIEELIFRGLLLQTLLRRMPFWPAALISTTVFAALHLYEVRGLASVTLLFVSIFTFGLGQCLLVRWTSRLGTSIVAHSISNAVSVVVTLAARR